MRPIDPLDGPAGSAGDGTLHFYTETASDGSYDLRWFTPSIEVALCGHATLASAAIASDIIVRRVIFLGLRVRRARGIRCGRGGHVQLAQRDGVGRLHPCLLIVEGPLSGHTFVLDLPRTTIASVSVLGALHATPAVKAALADRMR